MKKKILKALALVTALSLIIGICAFANALVGNPLSRCLAKATAEKHIEESFPEGDFYIEEIIYSFKDGYYHIRLSSPSSPDSTFRLMTDFLGKIKLNTYDDVITNKRNTADRIGKEYREAVDRVLESAAFPYTTDIAFGDIEFGDREISDSPDLPDYAIVTDTLELDAQYDIGVLSKRAGHLVIYIYDNEVTVKKMAEILIDIKGIMNSAGVEFYAVDCVLEKPKTSDGVTDDERVEVDNFLCRDIYEEGLIERVAEADRKAAEYHAQQDAIKQQEIEAYEKSLSQQDE